MVKVIIGLKGSGKTKQLIDSINTAIKTESGSMVCIEKGSALTFDIDYRVRLIDAREYSESGYAFLRGMVSGLHAGANPVSGDFSLLARGFEVAGGKPVRAVEQITVAGNFYRLLEEVPAAADDLVFDGSPVGCPTVMVKALRVAGE